MKARAKKETGLRVSSLAGDFLRTYGDMPSHKIVCVRVGELLAICASALSQDETKGQKPKRKRVRIIK